MKLISLILVIIMCLSLFSCQKIQNGDDVTESETNDRETTENTKPDESTQDPPVTLPEETTEPAVLEYPRTDGSTSTRPLDTAIRKKLLGEDAEDAVHTTTHESFDRLTNGECDLIFTVPVSDEQRQKAADKGVGIEEYPITKEAFVFVVNVDNPVSELTVEQLKGIYSGRITNWKEVGGNDAEIIPFQRNEDSGSQNYMKTFMAGETLLDAPEDYRPSTMYALMEVFLLYDNSANAIGYSYYAYAAKMFGNADRIKFIRVNGISPDDLTIENDTYPLISRNYAVIRSSEEEGSPARKLVEWLFSDEGQSLIADEGYFSVKNGRLPQGRNVYGTGKEKPSDIIPEYAYIALIKPGSLRYYREDGKKVEYDISPAYENGSLRGLKSEKMTELINGRIKNRSLSGDNTLYIWCVNGYLGIYERELSNGAKPINLGVFDLYEEKELTEVSDLFYKDADLMRHFTMGSQWNIYYPNGTPFKTSSPEEPDRTVSYEQLDLANFSQRFFKDVHSFNTFSNKLDTPLDANVLISSIDCVLTESRDMSEIWDPSVTVLKRELFCGGDVITEKEVNRKDYPLPYGVMFNEEKTDLLNSKILRMLSDEKVIGELNGALADEFLKHYKITEYAEKIRNSGDNNIRRVRVNERKLIIAVSDPMIIDAEKEYGIEVLNNY